MALPYHPHPGEVLICDFDQTSIGAEMVKRRPVIVVSRRDSHGRGLATVVPISTTAPVPVQAWHHPLQLLVVTGWQAKAAMWAKCDMVATVSFERLNKAYVRTRHGRQYVTHHLSAEDLAAVRACLRAYLGL